MNYIDQLIQDCHEAKRARPKRTVGIVGIIISEKNRIDEKNLKGLGQIKSCVYIIEELCGNSEEAFQRMELLKKERKRSVPKLNYPSPILYVGSSTTSITSRIKQHIGYGHPGTYALNLIHWLEGHYKITVREYELGRSALQIVEDALSHELAPAFGKMGGNSR